VGTFRTIGRQTGKASASLPVFVILSLVASACAIAPRAPTQMINTVRVPPEFPESRGPAVTAPPVKKPPPTPMVKAHTGEASWYGPGFKGKKTASGEIFDPAKFTAAHRTFPLGSRARVTHLESGKSVEVDINDRGPYIDGRIIDLSHAAARALGITENGTAVVRVELISETSAAGESEAKR